MSKANKSNIDAEPEANPTPVKTTSENVMVLNSESEARDLNFRLKAMETSLHNLNQQIEAAQDSMSSELAQIKVDVKQDIQQGTEEFRSETSDARVKLGYLEGSYQSLEDKSASLAQETARLTLQLDKNTRSQTDSLNALEENTSQHFSKLTKEIEIIDQQIEQLINDYTTLSMESQTLIGDLADKTVSLEGAIDNHEGNFKKLAQQIEVRNKHIDSKLEQVSQNFSFHDAKIMKLHEKDTELESQSLNIKEMLHQSETEQKESVASLEQNLDAKISTVSKDVEQKHQTLISEQDNLDQRTTDIEVKSEKLDSDLLTIDKKHQKQLDAHEERLTTHNNNLHNHETRLEQLQSVDEELNKRAQGLKETTELLNEHSQALEKTTVSLQEQSQDLQNAVGQLNKQNEALEEKTDNLGLQIVANAQSERQHFQTMTMAISIVAVLTIIALIYSFINQQSLWQSSMDNDVAVERRLNIQLSEQQVQLNQAEKQRTELNKTVTQLQEQLKAEKVKANNLIEDSQKKTNTLVQIQGELKEMDNNVNYLNSSVGPLKDYSRYTGKELQNDSWLANQPKDHFAIQLISVDSMKKLYQYINDNGYSLQNDLAWFTITSEGKEYYVLTYGSFTELELARASLSQLPIRLAEQSPGISRMKDIQAFIN